jgi:hypothetical protein
MPRIVILIFITFISMTLRVGWYLTLVTLLGSISHFSYPVYESQIFRIKSRKTYFRLDTSIGFSVSAKKDLCSCMQTT